MAHRSFPMPSGKTCFLRHSFFWLSLLAPSTSGRSDRRAGPIRLSFKRRRNQTTSFCGCTVCFHTCRLQWRRQLSSLAPWSLSRFLFCCHFFLEKGKRVGVGGPSRS